MVNRWKSGSFPNTAVVLRKWRTWFGTAKLLILYLLSMHLYRNMSIYYIILHIMLYFILYIRTYIYTHTSCHFLCIVTFIMFIYFLKTILSFQIFLSHMFLVLLDNLLFEKKPMLKISAESFWVILVPHFGGILLFIESS